jgi:hypothetical protein
MIWMPDAAREFGEIRVFHGQPQLALRVSISPAQVIPTPSDLPARAKIQRATSTLIPGLIRSVALMVW